jgi:Putative Actinobacterial Holin-X, holin superfamily III
MLNESQTTTEPRVTQLVSGILADAQDLFKQQLTLLRHEVQEDLQRAKEGGSSLTGGVIVGFIGALLLSLMLVHLLSWAVPALPMWACFGLIGAPTALAGSVLLYSGFDKLRLSNLLPNQSAQALKENMQWLTKPK